MTFPPFLTFAFAVPFTMLKVLYLMLTVKEAAEKSGIEERRLYYEIKAGYLKAIEKYGRFLIAEKELHKAIKRHKRKAKLTSVAEFCKLRNISRHEFEKMGFNVTRIDGELYIQGETND